MRIAVCAPQVPVRSRRAPRSSRTRSSTNCATREHEAELVTVPFKWYPGTRVLDQAFLWRLLDLTESDGRPIDLVVATKFPSYCVRHPNKRVWVLHQFRQAYELDRTDLGQFSEQPADRALRRSVQRLDRIALERGEAALRNVAERRRSDRALYRAPRRGDAAPAAGAALPLRRVRRLRPLREQARPGEADRPAARGGRARPDPARRRHRRRARPRAPGRRSRTSAA